MTKRTPPPLSDTEPTADAYAAFGRYAAALLGANAEWDDPAAYLEELDAAASARGVHGLGSTDPDTLAEWRAVAEALGVDHDAEDEDEDDEDEDEDEGDAEDSSRSCAACDDDVSTLSSRGLCDACEAEPVKS